MPQRLADDMQAGTGDGLVTAHCAAQVMDAQVFNIRTFQQCILCTFMLFDMATFTGAAGEQPRIILGGSVHLYQYFTGLVRHGRVNRIAILPRGAQIQPNPAPYAQTTKNCDAKCDAVWYNLWEIRLKHDG